MLLQRKVIWDVKNSHKLCTRYGKDSAGKFVTCLLFWGFDVVTPEWAGDIARSLLVLSATINIWGGAQSIKGFATEECRRLAICFRSEAGYLEISFKGQCPYYAHARASSVFPSKDNRTVILSRQDFLPDRTADGDLLFTFSSNILDFQRSLLS